MKSNLKMPVANEIITSEQLNKFLIQRDTFVFNRCSETDLVNINKFLKEGPEVVEVTLRYIDSEKNMHTKPVRLFQKLTGRGMVLVAEIAGEDNNRLTSIRLFYNRHDAFIIRGQALDLFFNSEYEANIPALIDTTVFGKSQTPVLLSW